MAYRAWRGAVELSGFPINVGFYALVKSQRTESFRTLAPNGKPIHLANLDSDGNIVPKGDETKGVEIGPDQYVVMTEEALEQIKSAGKSVVIKPDTFAPLPSLPFTRALKWWAVRADDKVAGAEQSVNVLWNGLLDSGLAYISTITTTSGGHDSIVAIYATNDDLLACALPFVDELYDVPKARFEVNDEQAAMFQKVIGDQVGAFDHNAYASEYRARRQAAIDAVIAGAPVPEIEAAPAEPVQDLMAVLAAAAAPTKPTRTRKAKVS